MNYQHLERVKLTLETVSPVFIGSSESYSKKELVILPNEGIVLIPDLNRLIDTLSVKNALENYEDYLRNEENRKTLREFLQEQGIPVAANAAWVQYYVRCGSGDIRINKLSAFIKNQQGKPYIPGSSIKGAIRTALIAMKGNDRTFLSVRETAIQEPKQQEPKAEEFPLRTLPLYREVGKETDAVNDLLRSLQVSDSDPFEADSLIVCRKLELTKDGERKYLPLYRECLRPGVKTHFCLTIDKSLAKDSLNLEIIEKALKQWMKVQYEYDDRFDQWNVDMKGQAPKGIPIALGGGVGFQSKSLLIKLKEDRDQTIHSVLRAQFKNYKYHQDNPAPYRMKLAQYKGSYYPMGRCSLSVEE